MAAVEAPPPPMKDDTPDIVVTVVHKVKSKLGYTEIHTPAPPMDENGKVRRYLRSSALKYIQKRR